MPHKKLSCTGPPQHLNYADIYTDSVTLYIYGNILLGRDKNLFAHS